jgi:hypothetical protein
VGSFSFAKINPNQWNIEYETQQEALEKQNADIELQEIYQTAMGTRQ